MRHSWRDSVATAGDLALLGFLVTLAAVPVVTAGAAVLTGSHAVSVFVREDRWPSLPECRAVFRRAFRPGLAGTVVVAAAGGVLVADFAAVRSGAVPGGVPMMVLIVIVALAGGGLVSTAVVRRERVAAARPRTVAAAAGVAGVVVLLALLVHPVLTPVLVGYWLFALHVVTRDQPVTGNELDEVPAAEECHEGTGLAARRTGGGLGPGPPGDRRHGGRPDPAEDPRPPADTGGPGHLDRMTPQAYPRWDMGRMSG